MCCRPRRWRWRSGSARWGAHLCPVTNDPIHPWSPSSEKTSIVQSAQAVPLMAFSLKLVIAGAESSVLPPSSNPMPFPALSWMLFWVIVLRSVSAPYTRMPLPS